MPVTAASEAQRPLDHRAIQRVLFRMQMDREFASGVLSGRTRELEAAGLRALELELVQALDPAAISADPGSKRRLQVLGNVASEFTATLALAGRAGLDPLATFPTSRHFHEAIQGDGSLPVAFAHHLAEGELGAAARALFQLERNLAEVRRLPQHVHGDLQAEAVALSPRAQLVELPGGTLALADEVGSCLSADAELKDLPIELEEDAEIVLLLAREPKDAGAWLSLGARGLPGIHVEKLEPMTTKLLRALEEPADSARREVLARSLGAAPEELAGFVETLLEEGVLIRGKAS